MSIVRHWNEERMSVTRSHSPDSIFFLFYYFLIFVFLVFNGIKENETQNKLEKKTKKVLHIVERAD